MILPLGLCLKLFRAFGRQSHCVATRAEIREIAGLSSSSSSSTSSSSSSSMRVHAHTCRERLNPAPSISTPYIRVSVLAAVARFIPRWGNARNAGKSGVRAIRQTRIGADHASTFRQNTAGYASHLFPGGPVVGSFVEAANEPYLRRRERTNFRQKTPTHEESLVIHSVRLL